MTVEAVQGGFERARSEDMTEVPDPIDENAGLRRMLRIMARSIVVRMMDEMDRYMGPAWVYAGPDDHRSFYEERDKAIAAALRYELAILDERETP